jgi:hypothetical protein
MKDADIIRLMEQAGEYTVYSVVAVMLHEQGITSETFHKFGNKETYPKVSVAMSNNVYNELRNIENGYLKPEKVPVRFVRKTPKGTKEY